MFRALARVLSPIGVHSEGRLLLGRAFAAAAVALSIGGTSLSCSSEEASLTYARFSEQVCELQMPCCVQASRPSTGQTCRRMMEGFESLVVYNHHTATQCLEDLKAAQRDANFCVRVPDGFASCKAAYPEKRGALALGATCTTDKECAASASGVVECTARQLSKEKGICQLGLPGHVGDSPCIGVQEAGGTLRTGETGEEVPSTGYFCIAEENLFCDAQSRTCTAEAAPDLSSSCSEFSEIQDCGRSHFCDPDASRCQPRKLNGAACSRLSECAFGISFCDPERQACAPRRPNGSACEAHANCASTRCEQRICKPDIGWELKWSLVCGGD